MFGKEKKIKGKKLKGKKLSGFLFFTNIFGWKKIRGKKIENELLLFLFVCIEKWEEGKR